MKLPTAGWGWVLVCVLTGGIRDMREVKVLSNFHLLRFPLLEVELGHARMGMGQMRLLWVESPHATCHIRSFSS